MDDNPPEDALNTHGDAETHSIKAGLEFVHVGQIIKNITPPKWLVKKYVEANTLVEIFGDPGSGKSFIAIDLACHIATGTPWHGHKITQGPVFYIAGEGHNGLARRFKAWEDYHGISLENAPIYITTCAAKIYDEDGAQEVISAAHKLQSFAKTTPELVIIDTLARNFGSGDENLTQDMNQFVRHVDQLKDLWSATGLIVHHCGHNSKDRSRGAMSLKGAIDHQYQIKNEDGNVTLQARKTKDGPDPDNMYFSIKTVDLPVFDEDGEAVVGGVLELREAPSGKKEQGLSTSQQKALNILRLLVTKNGEPVHEEEFITALINDGVSGADKAEDKRRSVKRVIKNLQSAGVTTAKGEFHYPLDGTDKAGRTEN